MFKNVLFIMMISAILFACGTQQQEEKQVTETEDVTNMIPVSVTVAEFDNKAGELIGKVIEIEGTVDHVCQHGGQRMFLVDEGTDGRVKVVTGEEMASFNTDLEGSDVNVKGIVEELRIDEDYLVEWENELLMEANETMEEEGEHQEGGAHEGSKHGEDADMGMHIEGMEQIENFRNMIKESDKDHLSFYSIVCMKYKVKEEAPQEETE